MKTRNSFLVFFLLLTFTFSVFALPQRQPGAKDLYLSYGNASSTSNNSNPGRPGSKLQIKLRRNGQESWVSSKTTFRSGDEVAFFVSINFPGYLTVTNVGSTGKVSKLFYKQVTRMQDYRIPNQDWIRFDNNPGSETVNFILTKSEVSGVIPTGSGGSVASGAEEQDILNALNSRAFNSKDLIAPQESGNETYFLAAENNNSSNSSSNSSDTIGFSVTLKHK